MSTRISGKHRRSEREHGEIEQEICCNVTVHREKDRYRRVFYRLRGLQALYSGISSKLTDAEKEWPMTTDVSCWYCRHKFTSVPVPIVKQYDPVTNQYEVHGVCCQFPCAKSYLRDVNASDSKVRLLWQRKLAVEVFGWAPDEPIPYAPDWGSLADVGGILSIDEFRLRTETVRITHPPFVPFPILLECHRKDMAIEPLARDPEEQRESETIGSINLKGLQRPDDPIDTIEKLRAAYPDHCRENGIADSVFQKYMDTETLPTPDECDSIREDRIAAKKAKRKRKPVASKAVDKPKRKAAEKRRADPSTEDPFTKRTSARKSHTPSYKAQSFLDMLKK